METIITASITAAVTLIVCLINNGFQNAKTAALISYRLEELEKKVDKHNNLVERMYCVEDATNRQADELKRVNERLRIVEGGARA